MMNNVRKLLPIRLTRTTMRGRLGLVVLHLLRVAEAALYVGTLTFYTADWSSYWLFSDWMQDTEAKG